MKKIKILLQFFYKIFYSVLYKLNLTNNFILKRKYYYSKKIFELEKENLFFKHWIFLGLTSELNGDKSWIVKNICGKEVLLTQDNGKIFAHQNICPHKNIRLCNEISGKGPLTCKYHAWSFNPDGTNRVVPFEKKSYKFNNKQKKFKNLTSYELNILGKFIFIKIKKSSVKFSDQFEPYVIKSLKLISNFMDDRIVRFKEKRLFNWKLNFENLRDALHPAVLHSKSLAKDVDFSAQYDEIPPLYKKRVWLRLPYASSFSKDGEYKKNNQFDELEEYNIKALFSEGYFNWLLFPNFHMASPNGGRQFNIEFLNPISPTEVEITHMFVMQKSLMSDVKVKEILIESRNLGRKILEEDYWAVESVQKGLEFSEIEQNVGAYEYWNLNIANMYKRIIHKWFLF